MEASDSCVRNLIFSSSFLLPFVKFFSLLLFFFFDLVFYYFFSFLDLVFYRSFVFPFFPSCFVPVFFAHVISSLTYTNLLENKMLNCVVIVLCILIIT
jgi:hypothetical protein